MLHGEPDEVVAAAATLARIGDPASYQALIPLLAHENAAVRQAAIGALNALGHPDMKHQVVAMLESPDPRERESAVRISGYFGYSESIDALLARCDDPAEAVRRAAVEHLPFLDDARTSAKLSGALGDPSARVRAAAAQALGRFTGSADRSVWLLNATHDQDAWVRYYAVRSLAENRERTALPRAIELGANDPAMHVRIAALEAVGEIGGSEAIDALLSTVGEPNAELVAAALRGLGHAFDARAEQALKTALRSDDVVVRLAAVSGLRAGGSAEAIEGLAWTAAADGDEGVARAAVEALGELARRSSSVGHTAVGALLTIATEPHLRDTAVTSLAVLPELRIPAVVDGLDHARSEVRRVTIAVLERMKHPDASAAIQRALDDDDATVRESAITALERLGTRGVARKLGAMAQDDPSRAVRRAASAALGRVDDPAR
jgi:HEAT repeat protein